MSSPVAAMQLEDEMTGESGECRSIDFKIGDKVLAPWSDGVMYPGEIIFESGTCV